MIICADGLTGKHFGNAHFIAMTVADTLGESADLFEIDTGDHYPRDYKKNKTKVIE